VTGLKQGRARPGFSKGHQAVICPGAYKSLSVRGLEDG